MELALLRFAQNQLQKGLAQHNLALHNFVELATSKRKCRKINGQ
jgi:hypothetical protein